MALSSVDLNSSVIFHDVKTNIVSSRDIKYIVSIHGLESIPNHRVNLPYSSILKQKQNKYAAVCVVTNLRETSTNIS